MTRNGLISIQDLMNCPKCGCEIDEMADTCPGCLAVPVETRIEKLLAKARTTADYERERVTVAFLEAITARLAVMKWQRRDLAREMGVSSGCVSQWFKGPDLRLSTMIRMARACGMELRVDVMVVAWK